MSIRDKVKSLAKNNLFLSSSFLAIISFLTGILNFVFNMLAGRILGPDEYGVVYPLMSLLMIVSVPAKAIQTVTTDLISTSIAENNYARLRRLFPKIVWIVTVVSAALIAVLLILMPFMKGLLHIQNGHAFILMIAVVFVSTIYIPFYSLTQSREKFFVAGVSQIAGVIAKFGAGIAIIVLMKTYFGVLWGLFAGAFVMALVLVIDMFTFKPMFDKTLVEPKAPLKKNEVMHAFVYSFLSYGAFQLITYLDPILVRHFLPEQSGVYSVVSLLGKASFYIAAAFSFVALPIMSKDKENTNKNNRTSLIMLIGLIVAYEILLYLFSGFISNKLFAGKYAGMESLLPVYGLMFLPYAVISFLVIYYFMTKKYIYTITLFIGSILLAAGIALFHSTLIRVSLVVGVVGYVILAVLLIDSIVLENRKKHHDPQP